MSDSCSLLNRVKIYLTPVHCLNRVKVCLTLVQCLNRVKVCLTPVHCLNRVKVCLSPAYLGGWQQKLWYQDWQDLKEFLAKICFYYNNFY
jgi:hypothetical protein